MHKSTKRLLKDEEEKKLQMIDIDDKTSNRWCLYKRSIIKLPDFLDGEEISGNCKPLAIAFWWRKYSPESCWRL
jgi:hypothetical protein